MEPPLVDTNSVYSATLVLLLRATPCGVRYRSPADDSAILHLEEKRRQWTTADNVGRIDIVLPKKRWDNHNMVLHPIMNSLWRPSRTPMETIQKLLFLMA